MLTQRLRDIADLEVCENVPMSSRTSLGIGGPADVLVVPSSAKALAAAMRAIYSEGQRALAIGNGTNMLVLDGGIREVVVQLDDGLQDIHADGPQVIAESGAGLASMCKLCADEGLSGIEWAAGIPGTIGGALNMNAGANGNDIGQSVEWVEVATPQGRIETLTGEELNFDYRTSSFQQSDAIIVRAAFTFDRASPCEIRNTMCQTLMDRCSKQPLTQRSAGSVFKRPEDDYAGRLLEAAGAKGLHIGGAQVSYKHANFIVNLGDATAEDVLRLVELVRSMVKENLGVELEMEVCVAGELLPSQQHAHRAQPSC